MPSYNKSGHNFNFNLNSLERMDKEKSSRVKDGDRYLNQDDLMLSNSNTKGNSVSKMQ
jgi:uncharacterized phosphosugar-binding protein